LRFLGFISPFSHFPVLADFQRAAQQQEDQEQKDEESEEKALHRMREWDDWKDTHPRGYGNRQNMG
jgi:immunoglobulin-binding protein 1